MTATENEITKKWRQLVLQIHPDKNESQQATEQTKILNDAKDRAIEECRQRIRAKEISRIVDSFMGKNHFNLTRVVDEMAGKIHQLNEEAKSAMDEKESLKTRLKTEVEHRNKMKINNQMQLTDLRDRIEKEQTEKEEIIKQLAEFKQKEAAVYSSISSKKRKIPVPETIEEDLVKNFVSSRIVSCPGNFSKTYEIHNAFLEFCNSSNHPVMSDCTFGKILKKIMFDTFSDQQSFGYMRERFSRERTRGYIGVALKEGRK